MPETLRGEKFWANIKDPADLAVKHAELVKYQGRSIAIPGKDAKPEDWENVYSKLRPEKPEVYEMVKPQEWPETVPYNAELEKGAREMFHKLGLTPNQGKELYSWYMQQNLQAIGGLEHRFDEDAGKLKSEWGSNYDREFSMAQSALRTIVGNNPDHYLVKWLDSTGEANNPVLIRFFNELAHGLGEDQIRGEDENMPSESELKEIETKINTVRGDPKSPFSDVAHPGHNDAVQEMLALYRKRDELRGALRAQ